jgi:Sec-independent protein translocase protein TatA
MWVPTSKYFWAKKMTLYVRKSPLKNEPFISAQDKYEALVWLGRTIVKTVKSIRNLIQIIAKELKNQNQEEEQEKATEELPHNQNKLDRQRQAQSRVRFRETE